MVGGQKGTRLRAEWGCGEGAAGSPWPSADTEKLFEAALAAHRRGQLTAADYDYQSDESYQYDANGNRVTANGSTYTTGTNNRLLSDGTYRYLYDAEGNRTHRFIDANANGQLDAGDTDITQYTWDHRNRLTKVSHRPSYGAAVDWVVRYWYDFQNRMVRKLADLNGDGDYEQKQNLAYDGNQVVMDFRWTGSGLVQTGDLEWRYLWGPAVDQILAEENVDNGADETVQWTLTDHLNTVRDIAKYDSGSDMTTVVNHLIYDAFGKVTSESNPTIDSLFLFTGRPFDTDTELQNNLNRWYDARVGRWMSEDPIGFVGGDGNLYRYVENTAHTEKDPNGLWPYFKPKTYGDCIKDVEVTYQGCRKRAAVVCELYARLVSGGGLGNEPIRRQIFLTCVLAYDFACQADRNLGWYLCRRWFCET
ncbi:MAG: RHS repeat-associated core domain-containing protein [Thermogutta sp.]